jgi:hypothetical protein
MSMTDIASPSFARTGHGFNPGATGTSHHSDRVDLMSTRSSLPDLLEQYVQIAVDARPSPLFFSLAYPTAPVRPVKLQRRAGASTNRPAARNSLQRALMTLTGRPVSFTSSLRL